MAVGINYNELIKDDAVHGRVFYDEAIFDQEMEKIFGRTWIYVGHESEIPEPGDWVGRTIGHQPVILARGRDRKVRLFLNRCRHRANTVCMNDRGRAANGFRCVYHGWTYATTGELVGVPYPEGFDPRDFRKADFPLLQVAMESYRGFVFGNMNPSEDLKNYLGQPVLRLLDQACDLSPSGELEVRSIALKHIIRGNWKLSFDNTTDAYHSQFLHQSSFTLGKGSNFNWDLIYGTDGMGRVRDLTHGHAMIDMSAFNRQSSAYLEGRLMQRDQAFQASIPAEAREAHFQALVSRLGAERAREVVSYGEPGPLTIFPNFSYVPPGEIRVLQPISKSETHVAYYPVLLKGAPDVINAERIRRESFAHRRAGLVTADDIDVFERGQTAVGARKNEWVYFRRGLRTEQRAEDGTLVANAHEETSNRALWHHYRQRMNA